MPGRDDEVLAKLREMIPPVHENADQVAGGLWSLRKQLVEMVDKVDDLMKKQAELAKVASAAEAVLQINPPAPPAPPRRGPDSVKHVPALAMTLLFVGLTAIAHTGGEIPVSIESGKAALRRENYVKAEAMFHRDKDDIGVAEAFFNQKRYAEAWEICLLYPTDGKAKLFLGLIARETGDAAGAFVLLNEAKALGNKEARDLLAAETET